MKLRIFYIPNSLVYVKNIPLLKLKLITNKIQKAIDQVKAPILVHVICLDFSKAFDTVNHNILIMKLDHYRLRGMVKKWSCRYLNERKQFVSIGNVMSDHKQISYGVPQKSVLRSFYLRG